MNCYGYFYDFFKFKCELLIAPGIFEVLKHINAQMPFFYNPSTMVLMQQLTALNDGTEY